MGGHFLWEVSYELSCEHKHLWRVLNKQRSADTPRLLKSPIDPHIKNSPGNRSLLSLIQVCKINRPPYKEYSWQQEFIVFLQVRSGPVS